MFTLQLNASFDIAGKYTKVNLVNREDGKCDPIHLVPYKELTFSTRRLCDPWASRSA